MSASTPLSSGAPQRNKTKTCKAIPWFRLAAVLGLYGFQGWAWAFAWAVAMAWFWGWTWAFAWAVAWAMAMAFAVAVAGTWAGTWIGPWAVPVAFAVAVAVAVAWAGPWAGAVAGAGVVAGTGAGIKLKAHYSSTWVFWILSGAALSGLCVGALLRVLVYLIQINTM